MSGPNGLAPVDPPPVSRGTGPRGSALLSDASPNSASFRYVPSASKPGDNERSRRMLRDRFVVRMQLAPAGRRFHRAGLTQIWGHGARPRISCYNPVLVGRTLGRPA